MPAPAPKLELSTTTSSPGPHGIVRGASAPFFSIKDAIWYKQWPLKGPGKALPRILIFTWATEESFTKYLNEVYWKSCYAHSHGFDIVFSSKMSFTTSQEWPMFAHLGYSRLEINKWAWVQGVHEYIISGAYEYVFMMREDVLIQQNALEFPVWAWDRGHHFTVMDQYHFLWPDALGLNVNNVLFKATWLTREFLEELFKFRNGFWIQDDGGPFMETLLRYVGRFVPGGYDKKCWRFLNLEKTFTFGMKHEPRKHALLCEYFSQCFFTELERLIGSFGSRTSQTVGFSPTYIIQNEQKLVPEQLRWSPGVLGPWANCWTNVRKWWPNPSENCFALHWKGDEVSSLPEKDQGPSGRIEGQCPDPTFTWTSSPFNPKNRDAPKTEKQAGGSKTGKQDGVSTLVQNERAKFLVNDAYWLQQWSQNTNFPNDKFPRVLIYTWCMEDTYTKYVNEVFWKTCYAFSHGFDVVFSASENVNVVKQGHGASDVDESHSEKHPWIWLKDIQKYLFSGEYDYVLMMRRDVLIQESYSDFPVWFWDKGHDITIMDQHHFDPPNEAGFKLNNILFRPTNLTKQFLDEIFEYRTGFYLQDDNGAYLETLLTLLGREANATKGKVYDGMCKKYMVLDKPDRDLRSSNYTHWQLVNRLYTQCFFNQLDALVGTYGVRESRIVGFTPTFVTTPTGSQLLPSDMHFEFYNPGPWANCWQSVRNFWTLPAANCFAINWNGEKEGNNVEQVQGTCPDLTFPWHASPYNPANRRATPA